MKFKIIDQEPIYIAGVVHYGQLTKGGRKGDPNKKHIDIEIEGDEEFQKGIEELRNNAAKLRDQIKDEVKFHSDHFTHDYRDHRKQWKENAGYSKDQDSSEDATIEGDDAGVDFESFVGGLGSALESFGRYVEKNSGKWEATMKHWGKNLETNLDGFGERMGNFGDNFGERMEAWGKAYGEQWDHEAKGEPTIKDYPIFESFEGLFEQHIRGHVDHIKQQTFYEVQLLEGGYDHGRSMTMVGSRMASLESVEYPVATMTFNPSKWVAVKLTLEEYDKDWLGSLEKVAQLKGYQIEPYFIVRHRTKDAGDEVRLFCPISEEEDER